MLSHTGQIALVRTSGFVAWMIRLWTGSDFNHMVVGLQGGDTASAEHRGVRIRHEHHFKVIVWSQFTETELQHWQVAEFAYQQLGKPYNWQADFWIAVSILTHRHTPAGIEARLNRGDRWQCAQLGTEALAQAGVVVLPDARPPATRFPGAFEKYFESRGWLVRSNTEGWRGNA
jgi:hypothetical protein